MYIFLYVITYLILVNADVDTIISEENFDTYKGEKIRKAAETVPKRFIQDLNDYEWHISHLKDSDLRSEKRKCKETFGDRIKNYKRMLANDASRIEFVSADAIPVNEKDLIPEKCEEVEEKPTEENITKSNVTKKDEEEVINTATTAKVEAKKDGWKVKKNKEDGRRASEYQFSSVEYYDEVPDFNVKVCPDAVEVILLQVDSIKPYDVQCELMLQWQSLQ